MTMLTTEQNAVASPALSAWSEGDQEVSAEPAVHVIDDDDSFRTGIDRKSVV